MTKYKNVLNISVVITLVSLLIFSIFFRNEMWYEYNLKATDEWTQLMDNIVYLSIGIAMFVVSFIICVVLLVLKYKSKRASAISSFPIFSLGTVTLDLGIFTITIPALTSILSDAYMYFRMVNTISLMFTPIALLHLLKSLSKKKYRSLEIIIEVYKVIFIIEACIFMSSVLKLSTGLHLLQTINIITIIIFVAFVIHNRKDYKFGKFTTTLIVLALPFSIASLISFFFINDWILFTITSVLLILIPAFINIVIQVHEVFEEAAINIKYKEFALKDIMTGLGSRFAYENLIEKYSGSIPSNLTLIFMDIDGLKTTNDTLGHKAGDEIIIAASDCIKAVFEDKADCFRMGGDEFLVAMVAERTTVNDCIQQFNNLVANWKGQYVNSLSVSCGYVTAEEHKGLTIDDMIQKADQYMYVNKKEHKKQQQLLKKKVVTEANS